MLKLKYPLFDGEKVWEGAALIIENGIVTAVQECNPAECGEEFLMPGLIDAHTHMGTTAHVEAMLKNGITATCDVSASGDLIASSRQLEIVSSAGMAMGVIMNPKSYVEKAAASGARYIKVLLFNPLSIGKLAVQGIVKAAHAKGLKVAVHATEVATVWQAVEANADILLHVPMQEVFPEELAKTIAQTRIAVAPTLVMMQTFAYSGRGGYKTADYQNAENAVNLLHDHGVSILVATDANPGHFAPGVGYGATLHHEMQLLAKAGLTPVEVLSAATQKNAEAFGLRLGRIAPGQPAAMLLVDGRPDRTITDSSKIKQVWVRGERIR